MKKIKILIIEDDRELNHQLSELLEQNGYAVARSYDGETGLVMASSERYQLILLDIMLPDGDGRSFLKTHRSKAERTPVIVLTARSEVSDRVGLLDLGADDYITKPFDFAELEARCRAVLRRQGGSVNNAREFADLVFDPTTGSLKVAGEERGLRNRELRLLEVFFGSPGQIFSKTYLMDRLFSFDEDVSENAIEVYVGRLRKKLEGSQARIETVRGLGYRMIQQS